MATAGLIQNEGIEQSEEEDVAATPALRRDPEVATPISTPSDGVQLPESLFDSLVETLRKNRLAQLSSGEQQREVIRYMRGLYKWLERDVHDRRSELRGVVSRVDQLIHDLRGVQMQGKYLLFISASCIKTNALITSDM
ncbi:hypothetical protein HYPSUDRAFT_966930 [Hypholoma sublateritium FD-334 SS-4]|uniref:Uncharacterized protein n=1 Tax=Hypholoma sublateritium (strain FD-334 SS-4) TaxID=945553 RepID=A0A0D2NGZ4_HYPSF|nr:hypothetical protein HYPSUDRAFT_966930 [Hypholoma sublateritium FD-334 SS-4]